MSYKKFTSIDEQLEILKSRGLIIEDAEKAKDFLRRNGYYRVSGYSLTLRRDDVFYPGITFQNIIDIYECDQELRHILLKYIEIIETAVKSFFSYETAVRYGPEGYLDPSNFVDSSKYRRIIDKAEKLKKQRLPYEDYLKHFVKDLDQDLPVWAFVDLLTISDISVLYSISRKEIKTAIAQDMNINVKGDVLLEKFLRSMTIIRNLCAHGGRLYNKIFEQKPSLRRGERELLIKKENGKTDDAHLYGFIFIMRRLLKADEFHLLKKELLLLSSKYDFVNMCNYGFRPDWKNVL